MTLTLPEDTIATLRGIDRHLGRAIVRLTKPFAQEPPRRPAELATFGSLSVMVVSPTRGLIERIGAELVPLSDGRALVAFDGNQSIPAFELRLRDALNDPNLPPADRETFAAIADLLRSVRQDSRGTLLPREHPRVQRERRQHPARRLHLKRLGAQGSRLRAPGRTARANIRHCSSYSRSAIAPARQLDVVVGQRLSRGTSRSSRQPSTRPIGR